MLAADHSTPPGVVDALAEVSGAVTQLAVLPAGAWSEVDDAALISVVDRVARVRAQLDAVLVAATARLEVTGAAEVAGWATTKEFVSHVLGGHRGAGAGMVRTAAQLVDLPAVRESLGAGRISLAQARVIGAEVAGLPHDEELRSATADRLLTLAADDAVDATGLRLAVPAIVAELDPDRAASDAEAARARAERNAHAQRHLSLVPDAYGGVRLRGYGTLEDAELIKTVLMPLAAPVPTEPGACGGRAPEQGWRSRDDHGRRLITPCPDPSCAHDGRDPRDHGVRMWDGLVEACTRLQALDVLPHQHGTRTRLVVTISEDSLRGRLSGVLPDGERLFAAAVRRLACDAEILPAVLGGEGQVLDVGRAHRLVTPAIWAALVLRDGHCTFPGCTRLPIACDAHHLRHWADGGATCLDNLALLCRHHHVLTHHSPWTVALDPTTRQPVWHRPHRTTQQPTHTYLPPRPPPAVPLAS